MSAHQLNAGSFVLTWLNIYAVAYYFNYLFFHLRDDFGFGNRENLLFAALNGLIYIPSSWFGGKFAQRHGCFAALKVGFGAMTALLAIGSCLTGPAVGAAALRLLPGLANAGIWTVSGLLVVGLAGLLVLRRRA
jgi:predicted MFS family arabinose efflux permease